MAGRDLSLFFQQSNYSAFDCTSCCLVQPYRLIAGAWTTVNDVADDKNQWMSLLLRPNQANSPEQVADGSPLPAPKRISRTRDNWNQLKCHYRNVNSTRNCFNGLLSHQKRQMGAHTTALCGRHFSFLSALRSAILGVSFIFIFLVLTFLIVNGTRLQGKAGDQDQAKLWFSVRWTSQVLGEGKHSHDDVYRHTKRRLSALFSFGFMRDVH